MCKEIDFLLAPLRYISFLNNLHGFFVSLLFNAIFSILTKPFFCSLRILHQKYNMKATTFFPHAVLTVKLIINEFLHEADSDR